MKAHDHCQMEIERQRNGDGSSNWETLHDFISPNMSGDHVGRE
jgi:hypothetical protein